MARGPDGQALLAIRLAWALRRARPDVILPYTMRPNVLCGVLRRLAGARFCVWNQRDAGLQRMGPSSREARGRAGTLYS